MPRQNISTKQHWLFGLAACLWPVAFALVGIFGVFPAKLSEILLAVMK